MTWKWETGLSGNFIAPIKTSDIVLSCIVSGKILAVLDYFIGLKLTFVVT